MIDISELDDDSPVTLPTKVVEPRRTQPKSKRQQGIMFFDLETVPDESRSHLFGLDPIPEPAKRKQREEFEQGLAVGDSLFNEYLKLGLKEFEDWIMSANPSDDCLAIISAFEKIAKKPRKGVFDLIDKLRKQDDARTALITAQRKTMAVTPEYCRIVAFGWAFNGEPQSMLVGDKHPTEDRPITERDILLAFWQIAKVAKQVCGFNVLNFDLPVIFVRSILLDVAATRTFDVRPWGSDVCDLFAKRFSRNGGIGLKKLCPLMGIEVPAEGVDGSQVGDLIISDPAKVGEYVRSDVQVCIDLHLQYLGFFF